MFFSKLLLSINELLKTIGEISPASFKKQFVFFDKKLFILIFLFLTLIYNYFNISSKSVITDSLLSVARWPLSVGNHLNLAETYFNNGNLIKAQDEFRKAQDLYKYSKVFDWQKKDKEKLKNIDQLIHKPQEIKREITKLEDLTNRVPNVWHYYLRLGLLYYSLNQEGKAQEYWQKSFYLNPNNQEVQSFGRLIGTYPLPN